MARPITIGVKVIILYDNKVLLVKTRYNNYWSLPGGGVKNGESVFDCARREVFEEVGVDIEEPNLIGVYFSFDEYKSDNIILLSSRISKDTIIKGLEIKQAEFFELTKLPESVSGATKRRLEEYQSGVIKDERW